MADVLVIADPETALGFRLAGVATKDARTPEEARRLILETIAQGMAGVTLFDEAWLDHLTKRERGEVDRSTRPILFPIPMGRARRGRREDQYLARVLRSAIGHQLKITR